MSARVAFPGGAGAHSAAAAEALFPGEELLALPLNRWLIARGKGHAVVHAYHSH